MFTLIKKYIKLYKASFINCIKRELEFRTNFFVESSMDFMWAGLTIVSLFALYRVSDSFGGWNRDDATILLIVYYVMNGFYRVVFNRNISQLPDIIRNGKLDQYLLKPVDQRFFLTTRYVNTPQIIRFLAFIIAFFIVPLRVHPEITFLNYLLSIVTMGLGISAFTNMSFILNILPFWTPDLWNIGFISDRLKDFASFPTEMYTKTIRVALYILPIAVFGTIPAKFLIGRGSVQLFIYSVVIAFVCQLFSVWVWKTGIRKYDSASS